MIDGNFFFDQPVKNDQRAYDNIKNCNRPRKLLHNWLPTALCF